MSTRLQIIISSQEAEEFKQTAVREGLTLSAWARQAMRHFQRRHLGSTPARKLAALERALTCGHPTGEIGELLAQIEAGRDLR